jgi:hypothetical protein
MPRPFVPAVRRVRSEGPALSTSRQDSTAIPRPITLLLLLLVSLFAALVVLRLYTWPETVLNTSSEMPPELKVDTIVINPGEPGVLGGVTYRALTNVLLAVLTSALIALAAIAFFWFRFWRIEAERLGRWNWIALSWTCGTSVVAAVLGGLISSSRQASPQMVEPVPPPVLVMLPGAPFPKFTPAGSKDIISVIYFATDGDEIESEGVAHLAGLAAALGRCATSDHPVRVQVEGVSSSSEFRENGRISEESRARNRRLANARAESVRVALLQGGGNESVEISSVEADSYDEVVRRRIVVDQPGDGIGATGIERLNQAAHVILSDPGRCRRT